MQQASSRGRQIFNHRLGVVFHKTWMFIIRLGFFTKLGKLLMLKAHLSVSLFFGLIYVGAEEEYLREKVKICSCA